MNPDSLKKKKKTKEEPVKGLGRRVTWSRSILKGQVKKKERNQTGGSTQNKLEWGGNWK